MTDNIVFNINLWVFHINQWAQLYFKFCDERTFESRTSLHFFTLIPRPNKQWQRLSSWAINYFLSHYSYIKTIMLYKGNHWTPCAGFMVASWAGITNDDLATSWAPPGDNLGITWGWLGHYFGKTWQDLRTPLDNFDRVLQSITG